MGLDAKGVWDQFAGTWAVSRYHILLEGPICRAWFMGEHVLRQIMEVPGPNRPNGSTKVHAVHREPIG